MHKCYILSHFHPRKSFYPLLFSFICCGNEVTYNKNQNAWKTMMHMNMILLTSKMKFWVLHKLTFQKKNRELTWSFFWVTQTSSGTWTEEPGASLFRLCTKERPIVNRNMIQGIEVCIKQYTKNSRYLHNYRQALLYVSECKMCLLHV
jgi:hypothetical protein